MQRRHFMQTVGLLGAGCAAPGSVAAEPTPPVGAVDPVGSAHALFDHYERRFAEARLRMPDLDPARPADRAAIIAKAKECLGIRDAWVPSVEATPAGEATFDGGRLDLLRAESWPGVKASALLYRPNDAGTKPLPLVVICCGHGQGGKLAPGYQAMARHLTRRGAMVLCPDNIGQGERTPMGHRRCVAPFACGLSVQGLIVMETLGWIAWARKQPGVDPQRVAAAGNSGGGTLTVFLAALCPDLAAVASSGYPSTFDFIARKEKQHCHCNLLPGIVGQLEMWQLLGCFAPRPLFIFQGDGDSLIPADLFYHVARKVRHVYRAAGADAAADAGTEKAFEARLFQGAHSWDSPRIVGVGKFMAARLKLPKPIPKEDPDERLLSAEDTCWKPWPADSVDTDQLAQQLSGRSVPSGQELWDVFPPDGLKETTRADESYRGETRQILAQFEAFLAKRG